MAIRVGINGFGRIGRQVLKAVYEGGFSDLFEIVAVNDLTSPDTLAHLLKYDSTYGRFDADIVARPTDGITVDGKTIKVFAEKDPARLPWNEDGHRSRHRIDRPLHRRRRRPRRTSTARRQEGHHHRAGQGRRHHHRARRQRRQVRPRASTTSSPTPPAPPTAWRRSPRSLLDNFGIKRGLMTTVHSYTNDQVHPRRSAQGPAPRPRGRDSTSSRPPPARPRRLRWSSRS